MWATMSTTSTLTLSCGRTHPQSQTSLRYGLTALPASDWQAPLHLGELSHWNWEPRLLLKVFKQCPDLATLG